MQFQKLKGKLSNEKKLARRISGLFGIVPALIMAFSFFPANQAQALDVDLSDEDFILLGGNPADINYAFDRADWYALGIRDDGASNHSRAQATHAMADSGWVDAWGYNIGIPRFHPKDSKSYSGKYGNKAYTLMDDSYGNKNIFKMLEVSDKSGDPGKRLRGTSKFYSGKDPWQRFEFEFIEDSGVKSFYVGKPGQAKSIDGHLYKVHMRSEKTGNYIASLGTQNGNPMRVARPEDNIDLWMVVWSKPHKVY